MGYEATRETIMAYTRGGTEAHGPDHSRLAEDAVFTLMSTNKFFQGRAAVEQLLDLLYRTAFEGRDAIQTIIVDEEHAVVEGVFSGKHIGDFDGLAATGKQVEVGYCAVYKVADEKIKSGHIYLPVEALRRQISEEG